MGELNNGKEERCMVKPRTLCFSDHWFRLCGYKGSKGNCIVPAWNIMQKNKYYFTTQNGTLAIPKARVMAIEQYAHQLVQYGCSTMCEQAGVKHFLWAV
jgi:hypothetical protein